ncbi:MAG: DUF3793 family protein [Clostridiales bacterium]|nr:DUF3793 family protein [Clostridiales bacterium]
MQYSKYKNIVNSTSSYITRLLAEHCMPVLLHIKPSNTLSVYLRFIQDQTEFISGLVQLTGFFGCRIRILYQNDTMLFVLIYYPELLQKTLHREQNQKFLYQFGYTKKAISIEYAIQHLKKRYQSYKEKGLEFPHEIGILLGYPYEDVEGFIRHKGKNYLYQECWKVYGNAEETKEIFDKMRKAKEFGRIILPYISSFAILPLSK